MSQYIQLAITDINLNVVHSSEHMTEIIIQVEKWIVQKDIVKKTQTTAKRTSSQTHTHNCIT